MQKLTSREIRRAFLTYFEKQRHRVLPSSPLIPQNDPTLLFTNAGMVQFKDIFLGNEAPSVPRAATCQKCVRAGGKHNDLENVGHTARHHTFFEMLGNFSFGDYFKEDAVRFGWEFLTEHMKLPANRLWVTVYEDDDEAERLWRRMGVSRIVRLGEKDNFWSMGEVGPCGPCSEILFDQGPGFSCGGPDCRAGCDCDRYLELWNLVFMQYNRDREGTLHKLPKPSIDTGMGLERISAVVQGVPSNFDCDLFLPLIAAVADMAGVDYRRDHEHDISLRVVADHARALAFLINDRVMPSNEGRGYVLRRIMRRAVRHGRMVGLKKPFLYKMAGVVADNMGDYYPELKQNREYIASLTLSEEERFSHTLDQGLKILNGLIEKVQAAGGAGVDGREVFKLYDTFGFPLDLTREVLQEKGLAFSREEFDAAMEQQQQQARKHWKGAAEGVDPLYRKLAEGLPEGAGFCRDSSVLSARVLAIVREGGAVGELGGEAACPGEVLLDKTPFYAEKGGQVTDTGWLMGGEGAFKVVEVREVLPGLILHKGVIEQGALRVGDEVRAKVDAERRRAVACNHTATHILHSVLRQVLGDHVKQAGSLVAPDRLRFDFTHFTAPTSREMGRVEGLVNEHIRTNHPVATEEMDLEGAIASGATALFDEKYASTVRVVSVGDVSKELCGGTHLRASGEIGFFKLLGESSVAAGVRRIEGVTARRACDLVAREERVLSEAAALLRCTPEEVAARLEKVLEGVKEQEKELSRLRDKMAASQVSDILEQVREVRGVKVLAAVVSQATDMERLRSQGDLLRGRLPSGVIVLGAEIKGKVALLALVSKDLQPGLHAGKLVKKVAAITGGGGGGRPDMAQAGGKDVGMLGQAIEEVRNIVEAMLK